MNLYSYDTHQRKTKIKELELYTKETLVQFKVKRMSLVKEPGNSSFCSMGTGRRGEDAVRSVRSLRVRVPLAGKQPVFHLPNACVLSSGQN